VPSTRDHSQIEFDSKLKEHPIDISKKRYWQQEKESLPFFGSFQHE